MISQPGVRFGLVGAALVAIFMTAAALHLSPGQTELVAAAAATVGGVGLPLAMAATVGATSWAFFTGFVENDLGQLTFSEHDVLRLVLFVALAVSWMPVGRRGYPRSGTSPDTSDRTGSLGRRQGNAAGR